MRFAPPASAVVVVLITCALLAGTATAGGSARPRVTVFGDSVAAALLYQKTARSTLGKGFDLQLDARVCRRLAEIGCPYLGDRPQSVLSLVSAPAKPLGRSSWSTSGTTTCPPTTAPISTV